MVGICLCQQWVAIDANTGAVRSVKALDRMAVQKLVIRVLVNDTRGQENTPQTDTGQFLFPISFVSCINLDNEKCTEIYRKTKIPRESFGVIAVKHQFTQNSLKSSTKVRILL